MSRQKPPAVKVCHTQGYPHAACSKTSTVSGGRSGSFLFGSNGLTYFGIAYFFASFEWQSGLQLPDLLHLLGAEAASRAEMGSASVIQP